MFSRSLFHLAEALHDLLDKPVSCKHDLVVDCMK
jgi:hypothetical protein